MQNCSKWFFWKTSKPKMSKTEACIVTVLCFSLKALFTHLTMWSNSFEYSALANASRPWFARSQDSGFSMTSVPAVISLRQIPFFIASTSTFNKLHTACRWLSFSKIAFPSLSSDNRILPIWRIADIEAKIFSWLVASNPIKCRACTKPHQPAESLKGRCPTIACLVRSNDFVSSLLFATKQVLV